MRPIVPLLSSCVVLVASVAGAAEPARTTASLEGTWVVESAICGDLKIEMMGKDKKDIKLFTWSFVGEGYRAFIIDGKPSEEGTFRVDSSKTQNHLDLTPTKGEILTTLKCLYVIDGDELKIALTVWFAPSTPEQELEDAKKMRADRPESFKAGKTDSPLVLTLKRQKQ
jgi:uncharacterized protein (TIGR03067 family)